MLILYPKRHPVSPAQQKREESDRQTFLRKEQPHCPTRPQDPYPRFIVHCPLQGRMSSVTTLSPTLHEGFLVDATPRVHRMELERRNYWFLLSTRSHLVLCICLLKIFTTRSSSNAKTFRGTEHKGTLLLVAKSIPRRN